MAAELLSADKREATAENGWDTCAACLVPDQQVGQVGAGGRDALCWWDYPSSSEDRYGTFVHQPCADSRALCVLACSVEADGGGEI